METVHRSFERQHRAAAEFRLFHVGAVDREADDFESGIMGEVKIRQLGNFAGPEHDDLLCLQSIWPLPHMIFSHRRHARLGDRFSQFFPASSAATAVLK